MDKNELQKKLVEIFATTKVKRIDIDDRFKEQYINSVIKSTLAALHQFIENGVKTISIKKYSFNAYDLSKEYQFGDSQAKEVWQTMAPIIERMLKDFGIPFIVPEYEITGEPSLFVMLIEDLRNWSKAETAGILL